MKLTTLHEAWDWKKFGTGAGAGIALGAAALTTGNMVANRYGGVNRHIHADTHLVDNPTKPGTPTTRPLVGQSEAPGHDYPASAHPVVKVPEKPAENAKDLNLAKEFGVELPVIRQAAERNNCTGDLLTVLLAIRKAENGPPGREFGVLSAKAKDTNLAIQAGWCAATIVKNHQRWEQAGRPGSFIEYLGNVYCPIQGDRLRSAEKTLNQNWIRNVQSWYNRLHIAPST